MGMRPRHLALIIGILCCQNSLAAGQRSPASSGTNRIRIVPSDTLSDLALAIADPVRPVIYYNPHLMARFGPEISAFVIAHERAHIELGHLRPKDGLDRGALERLLQSWELEADCRAAVRLVRERPMALRAALGFFERMGAERVDREHPTGSDRAERLSACPRMANGDLRRSSEGPRTTTIRMQFR